MAETTLNIINMTGASNDARTYRILAIDSASELPSGDSISFNLVFRNDKGVLLFKRPLKDADGNTVTISSIQDYAVIEYNFIEIEAVYSGTLPDDLKVYEF